MKTLPMSIINRLRSFVWKRLGVRLADQVIGPGQDGPPQAKVKDGGIWVPGYVYVSPTTGDVFARSQDAIEGPGYEVAP